MLAVKRESELRKPAASFLSSTWIAKLRISPLAQSLWVARTAR